MPKIIIIRGNSGSGKSTIAKALQRKFGRGTLLIQQDVIRRDMLWVNDGSDTKAIPLLFNLIKYGKDNCDYIILEGILNAKWYKCLFERIRDEFEPYIYAYYYDLPFEETLLRHKTKPNANEFGEKEMKSWWNEKDYIGFIKEKIITKDVSIDEAVDMIYKDVNYEN
ncbi:MAG TPA: uridine kinase [Clostridium sp.]|nr:uridine kinase [Clostridium sp.]